MNQISMKKHEYKYFFKHRTLQTLHTTTQLRIQYRNNQTEPHEKLIELTIKNGRISLQRQDRITCTENESRKNKREYPPHSRMQKGLAVVRMSDGSLGRLPKKRKMYENNNDGGSYMYIRRLTAEAINKDKLHVRICQLITSRRCASFRDGAPTKSRGLKREQTKSSILRIKCALYI